MSEPNGSSPSNSSEILELLLSELEELLELVEELEELLELIEELEELLELIEELEELDSELLSETNELSLEELELFDPFPFPPHATNAPIVTIKHSVKMSVKNLFILPPYFIM